MTQLRRQHAQNMRDHVWLTSLIDDF